MIAEAVAALRRGEPVVLPFDTVYGLAADPHAPEPTHRLYELKGRAATQPSALVAVDVDALLECVPELRGRPAAVVQALLPGPYTLILPNPARRFPWLTGTTPEAIGVRVPALKGPGAEVLARVGAVVATSANEAGGRDPAVVDDVPRTIRAGVAAVVDGGALPGTPSTVLDVTGDEPRIIRAGAVPTQNVLARVAAALAARSQ